jgi:predicted TIM-barrel fold metal-dependent hydrolase
MTTTQPAASNLEAKTVIDTDVHLSYSEELRRQVAARLEKPYKGYVDPESPTVSPYPSEGFPRTLGGRKNFEYDDVSSPEVIQNELVKEFNVDHPIINNVVPADRIFNTDRAIAETRAANDVLVENFLDEDEDFYGLVTLPTRAPDAAAEEIDRLAAESQIVGTFMGLGDEFQEKPPGDPRYDIIYQAMEDAGLPAVFHISNYPAPAPVVRGVETNFSRIAVGPVWCAMLGVTSLIAQGVPEKFPDLDFVIVEGGLSVVPHIMARLNRRHGEFRSEVPLLEQSPEEYIRDRFYFTSQPMGEFNDPEHMKAILDIIGTDSLLFSTDFPHHDFDHPTALDGFLQHFSPEEREQVLHGNAENVFGI